MTVKYAYLGVTSHEQLAQCASWSNLFVEAMRPKTPAELAEIDAYEAERQARRDADDNREQWIREYVEYGESLSILDARFLLERLDNAHDDCC